jgi:nitrogen fixation NifU-like protein
VIDHYENPRNVGSMDKEDKQVGTGLVGAPACGDVMKLQVCTQPQTFSSLHSGAANFN